MSCNPACPHCLRLMVAVIHIGEGQDELTAPLTWVCWGCLGDSQAAAIVAGAMGGTQR